MSEEEEVMLEFTCPHCGSFLVDTHDGLMECTRCHIRYIEFMGRLKEINIHFTKY